MDGRMGGDPRDSSHVRAETDKDVGAFSHFTSSGVRARASDVTRCRPTTAKKRFEYASDGGAEVARNACLPVCLPPRYPGAAVSRRAEAPWNVPPGDHDVMGMAISVRGVEGSPPRRRPAGRELRSSAQLSSSRDGNWNPRDGRFTVGPAEGSVAQLKSKIADARPGWERGWERGNMTGKRD